MAENTSLEDKRKELIRMMMDSLAVTTDESEGTQVTNVDEIHGCNTDYIDFDKPKLSPSDIASMLHLNDNGPFRARRTSGDGGSGAVPLPKTKTPGDDSFMPDSGVGTSGADRLAGDRAEEPLKWPLTGNYPPPGSGGYDSIRIPDDANMDDIVSAIIEDDSVGPTRAVIEFAQPSIRDEKGVDFEILVKPGDSVDENTILATAEIDGKKLSVKSIFGSGTVAADGDDYKRLYKGYGANRHFIIENYTIVGDAPEINTDAIKEIQDIYREEACINDMVTNNMCESILSWILLRRYKAKQYSGGRAGSSKNMFGSGFNKERPNGREIYGQWLTRLKRIKEEYQIDMSELASEANIRATNGNTNKLNELSRKILARRKRYGEELIYEYREGKNSLPPCEYDSDFADARYLASNGTYKRGLGIGNYHNMSTHTNLGGMEYNNYYVALMSLMDTTQNNKYVDRYRKVIEDIIINRMAFEGYTMSELVLEFNRIWSDSIGFNIEGASPFAELDKAMKLIGPSADFSDASSWISEHFTKSNNRNASYGIRQLANIYMFIKNYNEKYVEVLENENIRKDEEEKKERMVDIGQRPGWKKAAEDDEKKTILDLTAEEEKKLNEFWEEMIAVFESTTMDTCIEKTRKLSESINSYATWPQPMPFAYGDDYYEHYLFQNGTSKRQEPDGDVDYGLDAKSDLPKAPETIDPPEVTLDDLRMGADNIQEGEISIIDFDYWKKYFSLATIISLPFLNCGLDIPPDIMMIPFPCIFIALSCVYIKMLDLTLVVGLSIRGMYIWPIFLYVNCSQFPLSIMTPLIAQVKTIKSKISAKINGLAEISVNSIADGFIQMIETDSRRMRRENKQIETYISQIKTRKAANQEEIKRMMDSLYDKKAKLTQQVIDPLEKLKKRKDKEEQG